MIKQLFWKTYCAKAKSCDSKVYSTQFFRGFTWEVVLMAEEWAKNKKNTDPEKREWALDELIRIY